jgi:NADH dehydrogenase FAD-containing subunit
MQLNKNLRAYLNGTSPKPYKPQSKSLNLLSCGGHYAIGSWRTWSAQGRWVWWFKDWIDRRLIKKYCKAH